MDWERSRIEAGAAYLREMIEAGASDVRTQSVYEGLLDVLDPTRHATRIRRAASADAAAAIMHGMPDRRDRMDRRGHTDRRLINLGPAAGGERRLSQDRRSGKDRRSGAS
jgi:hypothetical protein